MTRSWSALMLMFVWLMTGYAVVHLTASLFITSFVQATWGQTSPYEGFRVTEEGDVIVETNSGIGGSWTYRRLDGSVIDDRRDLQTTLVSQIWIARKTHWVPIAMQHQMQSFSDYGMPAINWFLIRSTDDPETAYFMGFECRFRAGWSAIWILMGSRSARRRRQLTSFRIP